MILRTLKRVDYLKHWRKKDHYIFGSTAFEEHVKLCGHVLYQHSVAMNAHA